MNCIVVLEPCRHLTVWFVFASFLMGDDNRLKNARRQKGSKQELTKKASQTSVVQKSTDH